ncbi:PAAR domain-containing protein [Pseudoduganella sp. R-32]|uniref:PAAR domain-containing protein n=1 Tax=Pseudoduganella sp. R-32 TaxID=3404061 RepID=UPI003CF3E0CF
MSLIPTVRHSQYFFDNVAGFSQLTLDMAQAARLYDPIGHSPTMSWLLTGLLAGAAIAVAAVAIVGTGGLAAAAVVGGMAAAGAGVGEMMSTMSWAPKEVVGKIMRAGSANVFTNRRPAARAHLDYAKCEKHTDNEVIATGSGTVFINGMPAARESDKTSCSAEITEGSKNVNIGGETVQTDEMHAEDLVPTWVHVGLFVVGAGAAVVLGGPLLAAGGLVGGLAGGFGGGWLGGKIFGEGSDGQKWSMLAGSVLGGIFGAKGATWAGGKFTSPKAPPSSELLNQAGGKASGGKFPKSEGLGTHTTMAELKATGHLPGEHGVIVTDKTIRFGDVYELGTLGGRKVEFALVSERINGKLVKTLYSGDAWSSPVPKNGRLIGHVHPNEISTQKWPSPADMDMINGRYFKELQVNPDARPVPTRIFWGPGDADNTVYYPGFYKDPVPTVGNKR